MNLDSTIEANVDHVGVNVVVVESWPVHLDAIPVYAGHILVAVFGLVLRCFIGLESDV
mgnify:CR=1 FL=1